MMYVIAAVVIFAAGFVAGALVYRNNKTKGEQVVAAAETIAEKAEKEIKKKVSK